MSDEEEIWKTYPEFPFIEASNLGKIRTKDRYVPSKNGSKRLVKGHVLKQRPNRCGYMEICFGSNGKKIYRKTHRIIATCFCPNPNNYPEVNHIDNNPSNNVTNNLEWCTHEYNMTYREKFGVSASEATKILRKPVIAIHLNSLKLLWFESQSEAARQLGVSQGNISDVVKGERHKTGGCWFCYVDETAVERIREKFGDEIAEKVEKLISENCN